MALPTRVFVVAVGAMTPGEFITKWRASELKECSASQEHFIDLCRLLGERRDDLSLVKASVKRSCGGPWGMFMPWCGSGTLTPLPHGHRGFTVQSAD